MFDLKFVMEDCGHDLDKVQQRIDRKMDFLEKTLLRNHALEAQVKDYEKALEHIVKVSLPFTDKGNYSSTKMIAVECLSKANEALAKWKNEG